MWTDGVSPVKEIHVATTIIFFAGCIQRICDLIQNIDKIHWPTLSISLSSLAFLILGKELISPWLSTAFNFPVPFDLVLELYALGFVSVLSSFFPVFPVTSGFARSVVGAAVGGSTQLTCLFSSLALVLVILYIGPALEYLPQCILSTMIIVSQKVMFAKFAELRELWPVFKVDFTIWLMSMILTVCFDMGEGLLLATGFAVSTTIIRMQKPKWHFLSRDCNTGSFKETKKKHLEFVGGNVCVFRMDAPLIFTSIDRFTTAVWQSVKTWERTKAETFVTIDQMNAANTDDIFAKKARAAHKGAAREDRCRLVIDCGGFPYVDYLGLTTLKTVVADLIAANVQTFLVVQKGDMRKLFEVTDFYETVGRERIFEKLDDAVRHAEESVDVRIKEDRELQGELKEQELNSDFMNDQCSNT
ncbi:STAS domain protein [Ancylostoma ceylanicum]|uniref:STAS domain protein n=1 Tax=Ancylostoma ceylanicum TaxID=53326 RepID=A0A0D6M0N1_9BILA|nr:STAS domain protein [Ancylostoma ceylanicum]